MAIVTSNSDVGLDMYETYIASAHPHILTPASAGQATLGFPGDALDTLDGSGFQFDADGEVISGSIRSISEAVKGVETFRIDGFDLDLQRFATLFDEGGYASFFEQILSGDDLITGSRMADNIFAGGGNDLISAGGGNDLIDGGEGFDTVVVNTTLQSARIAFTSESTNIAYGDSVDELYSVELVRFADVTASVSDLSMIATQYAQWADRVASGAELKAWIEAVATGATADDVKAAVISYDFAAADQRGITDLYERLAGRPPSGDELGYWSSQLAAGTDLSAVRSTIVNHPIGQAYANEKIQEIYSDFAGRAADGSEVGYWASAIRDAQIDYSDVRRAVIDHAIGQEYANREIQSIYTKYAGRSANGDEVWYWASAVRNTDIQYSDVRRAVIDHQIGQDFASSELASIYTEMAGRLPTGDEFWYWKSAVRDSGIDYVDVRRAVIDHPIGQAFGIASIEAIYSEFAGRQPSGDEVGYWMSAVRNGTIDYGDVQRAVIDHPIGQIYISFRVDQIYGALLQRVAGSDEHTFWQSAIHNGATFETLVDSLLTGTSTQAIGVANLSGTEAADTFTVRDDVTQGSVISGFDAAHDRLSLMSGSGSSHIDVHEVTTTANDIDILVMSDAATVVLKHVDFSDLAGNDWLFG